MILFFLLALATHQPLFCTCAYPGQINEEQFNSYDLIAKGVVVDLKQTEEERIITFSVETYYKGRRKENTVIIVSPLQEGMCGIYPNKGEQWLMFAYQNGRTIRTDLCTRTKNMSPKAWNYHKKQIDEDIMFLERKILQNSQ